MQNVHWRKFGSLINVFVLNFNNMTDTKHIPIEIAAARIYLSEMANVYITAMEDIPGGIDFRTNNTLPSMEPLPHIRNSGFIPK